ncbi:type II toxin-antitoxin system RelE/ParE family toxin [Candidatus Dojkabacteria bacterium]|uniref:Type II toxin-antitoxin system RelE/ParE family toxin n=1 Tax=Candidatus Dojkabacteria bacterium TaxID=2099670 RepID=A0A955KZC4_9BACT|nr:type II toxin-antitoxin system RelE/ParE family toxin [Candidatus Dojkabacteria bacterium]
MSNKIEFTKTALRQAKKLPRSVWLRLVPRIESLAHKPLPAGSKQLVGLAGVYRIRMGDYRVIYRFHKTDKVITVVKIAHRREIYDRLG